MTKARRAGLVAMLLVVVLAASPALTIKLASIAPEQSPWGTALNRLAAEWAGISAGEVEVVVYHNGIAGAESDIIRKMRIGQLQAAVLTSSGMKQVVPQVFSMSVPFMISSEAELDFVMSRIAPDLEALFVRNRLHVLTWSRAGWIYFFSRRPVTFPAELKPQRLAADPSDEELLRAFTIMGYRPIPVPLPELVTSLNSGLVDAFYSSPLAAAGFQSFGLAPNMLDLKVAPFLGSIVITDAAWRRIPSRFHDQLLASARGVGADLERDVERLEQEAIDTMKRFGLKVTAYSDQVRQAWVTDVNRYTTSLLEAFDRDMTVRVRELLAEYGE